MTPPSRDANGSRILDAYVTHMYNRFPSLNRANLRERKRKEKPELHGKKHTTRVMRHRKKNSKGSNFQVLWSI
jgi:hypothetical protein